MIDRIGLSTAWVVLDETGIDRFFSIHGALKTSVAAGSSRAFEATGFLYTTIQILHDAARATVPPPPVQSPPGLYVEAVYDFVRKNYSRRTSVEEIARHVGLSRKYLSELVRSKTGSTPHEILQHHRLHTARELLLTTDLAVGDVARSCGYHDPLLFSRRFSHFFRCAPTEFRSRRRAAFGRGSTAGIECE
ncbi:MAG: AraC family transcriptional regulator [Spirochaetaceae bacterium]|nr:MAG: AraC family transcriptional regulator [Spirochaetaceae bacterium]